MKHDFVASYTVNLPIGLLRCGPVLLVSGWSISGVTRFVCGLHVTPTDNSGRSLLGTLGDGANDYLVYTPQYNEGSLKINTDGRNDKPAFNTGLFREHALGKLGDTKRRMFYGPGIENFDLTASKTFQLPDKMSFEFRLEAFNALNHSQFYGPAAAAGQIADPNFGSIVSAAAPWRLQLASKFSF